MPCAPTWTSSSLASSWLTMSKITVRTSKRAERLRKKGGSETFLPIMTSSYYTRSAEARQQAHDPAGPLAEQLGCIEAAGGALVDLAEGRIGRDEAGHDRELQASADRQPPGLDELAGMRTDHRRPQHAPVAPRQHLDEAVRRALRLRPVVLVERPAQHLEVAAMRLERLGLGHADLGELRVGIGDPGQGAIIDLGRQAEQRVANDDAGVVAGDVRELRPARRIADGIDASVGGAQPGVNDESAALVRPDPGLVEVEAGQIGAAAGRHQDMRAFDPPLAGAVLEHDGDTAAGALDAADLDARRAGDAIGDEMLDQQLRQFRIVLGENARRLEHGDARAQEAMRLCHLEADRAATDDD